MTKSLKTLLNDPSLIEKWIAIYRTKTSSELPEVQSRMKQLDQEIQAATKKINSLVQRVAELPQEVPADLFYEQIKQLNHKLTEAKLAKEKLKTKEMDINGQDIDKAQLKTKIERTLKNLDKAPKEKQRPIFTNLVKSIEIHPMKIKIGLFAPTKVEYQATGTDGAPYPETKTQNLNEIKEGKLIPFSTTRVGSSTVGNGARRGT